MNLPEPQSQNFESLMSDIKNGNIKIPQFQRDFVWNKEKSARLLDSIIKGYPIGTFILWKTKEELRTVRNLGDLELPKTPEGDFIKYILDGQQRLTTLFAALNGVKIKREDHEDDYSQFFINLSATDDDQIVLTSQQNNNHQNTIKFNDLLEWKISLITAYPENLQKIIQNYRDRIKSYQFSVILIKEAPIDVATEIFTRLNVSGKPLSVFEIMVAKTFHQKRNFDLAEKYCELKNELESNDFGTIPESVVMQLISILLKRECKKKNILSLDREKIIDIWPATVESIKEAIDYFRNAYRIPVSELLPYPNIIVPFAYYFFNTKKKPVGLQATYLKDFFWRVALGGRYSHTVESHLAQDVRKVDTIIKGQLPKYEWAIDTSPKFIENNGWFSVGRAYIKAILCLLAYNRPKSFNANIDVRISNDWLKRANSRNYHHFFPKAFLRKQGYPDHDINHIANITIVDDYLNKNEIKAQAPSKYIKQFKKQNGDIASSLKTHLIDLEDSGIDNDDYKTFFNKRCKAISKELRKVIIEQDFDSIQITIPANETYINENEEE